MRDFKRLERFSRVILAMCISYLVVIQSTNAQTFAEFSERVQRAPDSLRSALVDSFLLAHPRLPLLESDTSCHFLYRGTATRVDVAGDQTEWQPNLSMSRLATTNLWYATRSYESDARLDYKFVLNGSNWILDPANPFRMAGGFGANSELRMPGYLYPPELVNHAGIPVGTLVDTVLSSAQLGNSRTVRVYLPPNYASSADSFPVVLFHDGLEYLSLGLADRVLNNLINERRIQPIIAVFVPPVNRTAEYAGNQKTAFCEFIVNTVMPHVDSRYRTRRDPHYRAVMGASYGGNISLWLARNYPQVFGNVAPQSPYIDPILQTAFESTTPRLDLKVYLDVGTYDIATLIPMARAFAPVLQQRGYPYEYHEFHEGHSWGNWRAHIDLALEFFFPGEALSVRQIVELPDVTGIRVVPNPGNSTIQIHYQVTAARPITITMFDTTGREVEQLFSGIQSSGEHLLKVETKRLAGGTYFVRFLSGDRASVTKFIVLK